MNKLLDNAFYYYSKIANGAPVEIKATNNSSCTKETNVAI